MIENASTVLGILGLGGLLGTYFRILWERKTSALLQKQEFKEARYKCIIILLRCYLDFEKNKSMLHQHGRTYMHTVEDLKDELETEWINMILFASEDVLLQMHNFIESPSKESLLKTAAAMRGDLWDGKISLNMLEQIEHL